jgi:hypothetical protein
LFHRQLEHGRSKLKKSRLNDWALAIQSFEGFYPGSRSFKNNNPGNLKYVGQLYATGHDDENHAIFDSYQHGFDALIRQLQIAVNGNGTYNGTMTLRQFFHVYAEANSDNYASFVATKLGVSPEIQIRLLA